MKQKNVSTWAGFTIVLKLFCGMLVNIKAGTHTINRKELRSTVGKIGLWNEPLISEQWALLAVEANGEEGRPRQL